MRIKKNYMLRSVAGQNVVVPVGGEAAHFNGMISLNDSGAFLWRLLENEADEGELFKALLAEYEVDEATARRDASAFVNKMREAGLLEE